MMWGGSASRHGVVELKCDTTGVVLLADESC